MLYLFKSEKRDFRCFREIKIEPKYISKYDFLEQVATLKVQKNKVYIQWNGLCVSKVTIKCNTNRSRNEKIRQKAKELKQKYKKNSSNNTAGSNKKPKNNDMDDFYAKKSN